MSKVSVFLLQFTLLNFLLIIFGGLILMLSFLVYYEAFMLGNRNRNDTGTVMITCIVLLLIGGVMLFFGFKL